ncbi:hypothetical protein HWV23_05205 [Natronomonas halophila]|uniref:hypothetical protein n=1 Tax=Natronomonas halophila TaxID=2747817 RepID=UPI0015B4267E|nr:hypothetical protein [Natronomonas halophila]QLD85144.1 hypothetical protein HWV23_05205 [Natronomonas halophila]
MDAKTAFGIALALALGLPYVTVGLMEGGRLGILAFSALFVVAIAVIIVSDRRTGESASGEE